MKESGTFATFPEAFVAFYQGTMDLIKGGCSRQVLDTACWIECIFDLDGKEVKIPIYVHQMPELCHELGLLVDGKLVDEAAIKALPPFDQRSFIETLMHLDLIRHMRESREIIQDYLGVSAT